MSAKSQDSDIQMVVEGSSRVDWKRLEVDIKLTTRPAAVQRVWPRWRGSSGGEE